MTTLAAMVIAASVFPLMHRHVANKLQNTCESNIDVRAIN